MIYLFGRKWDVVQKTRRETRLCWDPSLSHAYSGQGSALACQSRGVFLECAVLCNLITFLLEAASRISISRQGGCGEEIDIWLLFVETSSVEVVLLAGVSRSAAAQRHTLEAQSGLEGMNTANGAKNCMFHHALLKFLYWKARNNFSTNILDRGSDHGVHQRGMVSVLEILNKSSSGPDIWVVALVPVDTVTR